MTASATAEAKLTRRFKGIGSQTIQRMPHAPERQHSLVVWIALIGIFFPPASVSLGGINFTPARFIVTLLLIPAFATLAKRGRNRAASDFFVISLAVWMVVSSILNGGFTPYVGAEGLELLGPYMIGRAFIVGPSNFRMFVRVLGRMTVFVIALALLDIVTQRRFTLDIFGVPNYGANLRNGWVRAGSVFDNAEHYGTFCAAAAAIFLYAEHGMRRLFYVGLSFFGCILSVSSGPIMGLGIVVAVYSYDSLLKQYLWRWKVLALAMIGCLLFIFLYFDFPLAWLIVHFTFDPQTGFFRLGTWNAALPLISEAPFIGHGMSQAEGHADIFLSSVDCVWLVEALRYGYPGIILLLLTMLSPILSRRRESTLDPRMDNSQTGMSLAVITIGLIGLTVHFWNGIWLFMSLCIGIRASIREYAAR